MKIFFLSIIAMLFCCTAVGHTRKNNNPAADLKTLLNGKWILVNYLDSLKKTKSPLKAQAAGSNITQLFVNTERIEDNAVYADGWSLHEGGLGFLIILRPGIKKNTFRTEYNSTDNSSIVYTDIGSEIKGKDSFLVLYHYNEGKKFLGTTTFSKAGAPNSVSSENFLGFVVNKTLFAGKYAGTDNAGKKLTVSFTSDGEVSGLPECTNYEVTTYTLETGNGNDYDKIYLADGEDKPIAYAFKIEGSKLLIYALEKNAKKQVVPGALKYSLIKK